VAIGADLLQPALKKIRMEKKDKSGEGFADER
jgi:hypothetical protein